MDLLSCSQAFCYNHLHMVEDLHVNEVKWLLYSSHTHICWYTVLQEPQNGSGLLPVHSDSDAINSSSDAVTPAPDSPYADLGEVEPVNLISFAYQIASGMVMEPQLKWC